LIKLSILIPTIECRVHLLGRLISALEPQLFIGGEQVAKIDVLSDKAPDPKEIKHEQLGFLSTGAKRNKLEQDCGTEYCVHFDDDDMPSDDYVSSLYEGIKKGVDVVTFRGEMCNLLTKARNEFVFHILDEKRRPMPYDDVKLNGRKIYRRPPNHLCCIKTELALKIPFADITWAEDYDKCLRMQEAGLLKTEHHVNKVLYYYLYTPNK